jgi:hypothetical protein
MDEHPITLWISVENSLTFNEKIRTLDFVQDNDDSSPESGTAMASSPFPIIELGFALAIVAIGLAGAAGFAMCILIVLVWWNEKIDHPSD